MNDDLVMLYQHNPGRTRCGMIVRTANPEQSVNTVLAKPIFQ